MHTPCTLSFMEGPKIEAYKTALPASRQVDQRSKIEMQVCDRVPVTVGDFVLGRACERPTCESSTRREHRQTYVKLGVGKRYLMNCQRYANEFTIITKPNRSGVWRPNT